MEDGIITKPADKKRRERTFFRGNYPKLYEPKRGLFLPFWRYLVIQPLIIKLFHSLMTAHEEELRFCGPLAVITAGTSKA